MNILAELKRLEGMSVPELRTEYAELFGESARSGNRRHLIRRIAWRLQANVEGGLSERARRRALEMANIADLRLTAPRSMKLEAPFRSKQDSRLPMPGTVLTRLFQGKAIRVTVLSTGFECQGRVYRTLSAVAKAATGRHWNGFYFFGLVQKEGGNDRKE